MLRRTLCRRAQPQQQPQQAARKDMHFRHYNPSDPRPRLAVLIDAETLSVQTHFWKLQPLIRRSSRERPAPGIGPAAVLLNRVFAHTLKPDWQQVVLNRGDEAFEPMIVERFIAMHMQVTADAAHIVQMRMHNHVSGIVICCEEPSAQLYCDQLEKREVFSFVDRYVITETGIKYARRLEDEVKQ